MKDWIRRWLGIKTSLLPEFESRADAQKAHIADLRILIDKAHEREAQLAEMVKLAMEHQFYRPVVTRPSPGENKVSAALPAEHMQDVAVFDEQADREQIEQQENELKNLIAEQNEAGSHKVGA